MIFDSNIPLGTPRAPRVLLQLQGSGGQVSNNWAMSLQSIIVPREIVVAWPNEWPIKSGNDVKIQAWVYFSF